MSLCQKSVKSFSESGLKRLLLKRRLSSRYRRIDQQRCSFEKAACRTKWKSVDPNIFTIKRAGFESRNNFLFNRSNFIRGISRFNFSTKINNYSNLSEISQVFCGWEINHSCYYNFSESFRYEYLGEGNKVNLLSYESDKETGSSAIISKSAKTELKFAIAMKKPTDAVRKNSAAAKSTEKKATKGAKKKKAEVAVMPKKKTTSKNESATPKIVIKKKYDDDNVPIETTKMAIEKKKYADSEPQ